MAQPPCDGARRILVLVPHPDDETAGCATALRRARAAGAELFGIVLTTGIPAVEVLWPWSRAGHARRIERRNAECRAAAKALGITLAFRALPTRKLRHDLRDALAAVLARCARWRIDTLWAPAYEGGHPDHDSASALACEVARARPWLHVFEYAEYNNACRASHTFPEPNGTELEIVLGPDEQRAKRRLLAGYRSARRDLRAIGVARECFRPLVGYDYSRPPHPGKLFYERFHWVPFRHPRIDRTTGAEVCADLVRFRAQLSRGNRSRRTP